MIHKYIDEDAMNSLFAFIEVENISEEQFEELKSKLHDLGWFYDVSSYKYWSEYEEEWYFWSLDFGQGEEYEAYKSISHILEEYDLDVSGY